MRRRSPVPPAAVLLALLSACGGDTARDVLPPRPPDAVREVLGAVRDRTGGRGPAPPANAAAVRAALTPQVRATLPPGTLLVVHERSGATSLPQRVATAGGVETVLTEDGITLSFRDGVLVASRGLGLDLMESRVGDVVAALRGGAAAATRSHAWLDGADRLVTRSFACRYAATSDGVRERCDGIGLGFENLYVVRGGRIVASRQWLGPEGGHIYVERLTF